MHIAGTRLSARPFRPDGTRESSNRVVEKNCERVGGWRPGWAGEGRTGGGGGGGPYEEKAARRHLRSPARIAAGSTRSSCKVFSSDFRSLGRAEDHPAKPPCRTRGQLAGRVPGLRAMWQLFLTFATVVNVFGPATPDDKDAGEAGGRVVRGVAGWGLGCARIGVGIA
jgi:hypothetical protein